MVHRVDRYIQRTLPLGPVTQRSRSRAWTSRGVLKRGVCLQSPVVGRLARERLPVKQEIRSRDNDVLARLDYACCNFPDRPGPSTPLLVVAICGKPRPTGLAD
jgi:hypothetical protein